MYHQCENISESCDSSKCECPLYYCIYCYIRNVNKLAMRDSAMVPLKSFKRKKERKKERKEQCFLVSAYLM